MNSRDKIEKRTIVLNDGQKIQIPKSEPRFLLYPYDAIIKAQSKSFYLIDTKRPTLGKYCKKLGRYCKDMVYILMASHCAQAKIKGQYIGLAANYPGEIYMNFRQFIQGNFYSYELDNEHYKQLLRYQSILKQTYAHTNYQVDFKLKYGDIITGLYQMTDKAAIIDLDFMGSLGKGKLPSIYRVVRGIDSCAANKAVVGIWQTVGRHGWTDKELNEKIRPNLQNAFAKRFRIKKYDTVDYWEGYPMRVDIFTLERKQKCKKESSVVV